MTSNQASANLESNNPNGGGGSNRRWLKGRLRVRRLLTLVSLTAAWCVLWGQVSAANVLSGLALALLIERLGVGTGLAGGIRLLPLIRLVWMVIVDMVRSTVNVAIEILTPTDRTEESIVAVHLGPEARDHLLLLIIAVTVTPGTAVVDADPDTGTLFLHLLHHDRAAETTAHVHELADLADRALPGGSRGPDRVSSKLETTEVLK